MHVMTLKELNEHKRKGILTYKWRLRSDLMYFPNKLSKTLVKHAISPIIYLMVNMDNIRKDKSLYAVYQICSNIEHIINIDHYDKQLYKLSRLFNQLINSSRPLHMCYDCGTLARGIFLQLIQVYRGQLKITNDEIQRFNNEYYMDKYQYDDGVFVLEQNIKNIKRNCLFLCAMSLGGNLGHVYVLEKIYINKNPRFRIYQSCLNSYLLVDYIEFMDYAGKGIMSGIDIKSHINSLHYLFSTNRWGKNEKEIFINWFKFDPNIKKYNTDPKRFTSTYILL